MNWFKLFDFLGSTLFPSRCPYCNCVIHHSKAMCEECSSNDEVENIVTILNSSKNISPYSYDGKYSKAVKDFKFYGNFNYGEQLAISISDSIRKVYSDVKFEYIAYVPVTKRRKRKRGYNQSELLAKNISKCLNIPYKPILVKIKENKTQHLLSRTARIENVKGCFKCNTKININAINILLIDDILTTGSTLNECVSALKNSGANKVYCATFATVKKP